MATSWKLRGGRGSYVVDVAVSCRSCISYFTWPLGKETAYKKQLEDQQF